jgi:distribution and morphology protein 12
MSIDLEWNKLDSSLAFYLVEVLNRQLSSAERPSFLGPVEVTSLDFGSTAPDVELVDLRDIYRDFLEDDDGDFDRGPVKVTEGAEDEEGFEWVSRRAGGREEGLAYHHLPPHVRYGRYGSASMFAASPSLNSPADVWTAGNSLPNMMDYRHAPWSSAPMYRSPSPATPFSAPALNNPEVDNPSEMPSKVPIYDAMSDPAHSQPDSSHLHHHTENTQQPPQPTEHPNLQLHLHINWHSNLRIILTTSLLINYPSPMFMSLPIKLSVTGLIFAGELAVAYEGARRRVHICILDDLDPYGPAAAGDRPKRNPNPLDSAGSTPPELDEDSPQTSAGTGRLAKPLPVGQRLLPSIYIESEIGQADKHVLKNVTRVERFIQDVIRKTVEEELVFPNFHTLVMGDG